MKNRKKPLLYALAALLLGAYFKMPSMLDSYMGASTGSTLGTHTIPAPKPSKNLQPKSSELQNKVYSDLPSYAQHTADYLKSADNNFAHSEPGYVGGREFTNFEKVLPTQAPRYYHEWDVHPKQNGVNRGTERLVSGQNGELYYTDTHYGDAGSPAFYIINQ